jgi:predicted nucleotidyltransferase
MAIPVRPDQALDPATLEVLREVASAAETLDLEWFVAGAMARDIVLTGVHGIETGRATRDVDLAFALAGWPQFEELKQRLLGTARFSEAKGIAHRLLLDAAAGRRAYPVDIIPFGAIAGDDGSIAWPPDHSIVMSTAGYREIFAAALEVEVSPGLVVRIASLPGLAVMKVVAWRDRGAHTPKDAQDLATIFRHYVDAGNFERLYADEFDVMQAVDHRLELAGPRLLGRDAGRILNVSTARSITDAITGRRDTLIAHLWRAISSSTEADVRAEQLLDQFVAGLEEVSRQKSRTRAPG